MSNLVFAWPYAALLLFLLFFLWWYDAHQKRSWGYLESPMAASIQSLLKDKKGVFGFSINWFLALVWTLMVFALMRPQLVGDPIEISRHGRAIMLVLDISESMEIEDMELMAKPTNRLVVAKEVIDGFIDKRRGDRIGLVVFGSEAFLHAPLSFDHPMIKQFLAGAQIGFAGPKTAIGDAVGLAAKKLIEQTQGERIMVLLTDGQNNMGSLAPLDAGKIAQKHQIKIYIAGLGSSRMVVDGFFGPQAVNPSLSLDEAEPELKNVASMTGGRYFRARDRKALDGIYADIDRLEPIEADPQVLVPRKEVFYWPLGVMVLMFALRAMWLMRKSHALV